MGKVKKIFKKVAPIVLPIALGAMTMGPIAAATLGSGIGTLISGGSFKQALMSAAMGAAFSGGLGSLASSFGPTSTFVAKSFGGKLMAGIGNLSQKMVNMTGSAKFGAVLTKGAKGYGGITSSIGQGIRTLGENVRKGIGAIIPNPVKKTLSNITQKLPGVSWARPDVSELNIPYSQSTGTDIFSKAAQLGTPYPVTAPQGALAPSFMTSAGRAAQTGLPAQTTQDVFGPGWKDTRKLVPPTIGPATAPATGGLNLADALDDTRTPGYGLKDYASIVAAGTTKDIPPVTPGEGKADDKKSLWSKVTGGTAKWWNDLGDQKYGPAKQLALAGLATAGAYGAYKALTTKEIEDMSPEQINQRMASIGSPTDPQYISQFNPTGMYSAYPSRPTQEMFAYDFPTAPTLGPNLQPWTPVAQVEQGGIMNAYAGGGLNFPRKQGPINGPGTGTSDDVPAMLSDGEFVMTSQAVRNAGGGSRALGSRRMYNLMNNLEQGVA